MCAAPGGKATAIAGASDGRRVVIAGDQRPGRARLVRENARGTRPADARRRGRRHGAAVPAADDSTRCCSMRPCSGLGALRRRADARWRITAERRRRAGGAPAPPAGVGGRAGPPRRAPDLQRVHDHRRRVDRSSGTRPGSRSTTASRRSAPWRPFGQGWRVLPHDADTDGMVIDSVPSIVMSHDHGPVRRSRRRC